MDVDFWAGGVHRHIPSVQSARLGSSGINHALMEEEGGDEVRAWFPCPFCYIEIEVALLCVHLQEEHCFDLKNAVCPICAANLGRDALGHFAVQHAYSIKQRRKKSQKSGFWSNVSTNIVKDLRELSSTLSAHSANESAPDPLLSSFLCTVSVTDSKDNLGDVSSSVTATNDEESSKPSCLDEDEGLDHEEVRQRAAFVEELLFSTIFSSSVEEMIEGMMLQGCHQVLSVVR